MGHSHGRKWTDERIIQDVLEVKEALGIDRMPSRKECEIYFHNTSLDNAIAKRKGGWYKLAGEMGLEIKKSETLFGKTQERRITELLIANGFNVRQMSQNFPYDLLVNDCAKVDVKASHLYRGANGNFYTFNLQKPFATCDLYILLALNDNNEVNRIFFVPSKFVISINQISIGEIKSKYDKFVDRIDLLQKLCDFYEALE